MNNKKENLVEHLYLYYLDILKEGNDTRNEGLSWIVKEIFYLGKNALISYFPKYLDDISIQYIINQAKLNILMENIIWLAMWYLNNFSREKNSSQNTTPSLALLPLLKITFIMYLVKVYLIKCIFV